MYSYNSFLINKFKLNWKIIFLRKMTLELQVIKILKILKRFFYKKRKRKKKFFSNAFLEVIFNVFLTKRIVSSILIIFLRFIPFLFQLKLQLCKIFLFTILSIFCYFLSYLLFFFSFYFILFVLS